MKNPKICQILKEAVQEERDYKSCLIEDIIKAKRLLYAFGQVQHSEFLTPDTAKELEENLNDLDVPALEIVNNQYGKQINDWMINRIKEVK